MAVVAGELVVFGGWDPQREGTGGVILDDVWTLDLETFEWTQLEGMPRGPCSRHVAVATSDAQVVVHTFRCAHSVLAYDATTRQMREVPTVGEAPSSRGLHSAALCGREVVIFGGADKQGTVRDDAWALDTATWTWRRVVGDEGPTPRAGSSAAALDRNTLLVCCGAESSPEKGLVPRADVWALDLPSASWTLLLDDDDVPPRNAAAFAFLDSSTARDDLPADDGGPLLDTLDQATTDLAASSSKEEVTSRFLLHGGWHPFVRTFDDTAVLEVVLSPRRR
mmetsp:Transcript_7017/g.21659  ORF Transcript_7017/g.21659 Transcript_7017/m.21659 type:complete len:280 (+) Transcript_7017:365-1204(+)